METIVILGIFIGGGVLGYTIRAHMHAIADKAASIKTAFDKVA